MRKFIIMSGLSAALLAGASGFAEAQTLTVDERLLLPQDEL